ncbi:MAG: acyl-CoA dehydrogenase [Dehalococcoidia bacterium]|nr:acyl-CoA dehydrogenase [Dehalococcoidia bacterium]
MDLALNEEQELLKRAARDFLEVECPVKLVREMEEDPVGFPTALWKQLANLGWQGLCLPERFGGGGSSLVDMVVLLEEMGRRMVPGPFLPCVIPCATTIARHGDRAQQERVLPGVIAGDRILTWAGQEPVATYLPTPTHTTLADDGDQLTLSGVKLFVAFANVATDLLVTAKDGDGVSLVIVDRDTPGVTIEPLAMVDGSKQFEVRFDRVRVPHDAIVGPRGAAGALLDEALAEWTVALCAWMAGMADAAFEMTIEYTKTRVQFGRPIGSFQALQQRAADLAALLEGCKLMTYQAAWRVANGEDWQRDVAMAKAWVSDSTRAICAGAHQMHGAIGFTWEYDLQLYTRRARAMEVALGDGDYHRKQIAVALGL